ncbi:hypothetical protein AB0B50_13095 [Streptomyces sp. NPDC041068]|uniref:hypothetical protein n=1 Tax=Streptomyces sp. NPDC041068 TaxID=3155130 RepID=UPI0033D7E42D
MKSRYTPRPVLISLIAGVLAVTAVLGWPAWMWFPLAAVVAGALLLDMFVLNVGRRTPDTGRSIAEDGTEFYIEPPYLEMPVNEVPVASGLDGYPLLFSATVRWRTDTDPLKTSHGNPGALAVTSILRRVEECTATEHPSRVDFLCHWLEGQLGQPVQDESGTVMAFATDVRLHLRHEDRRHLDELEELRKSIGSWEQQREHERNRREYLGEDVLQSPGSAVVWWLARHEDEIERATDLIGPLSCLSAAANDLQIPDAFRHLTDRQGARAWSEMPNGLDHPEGVEAPAEHQNERSPDGQPDTHNEPVSALLDKMGLPNGSEERDAFVHRLARMMEASGRPLAAEALRHDLVDGPDNARHGAAENPVAGEGQWAGEAEPYEAQPTHVAVDQVPRKPDTKHGLAAGWWQTAVPDPGVDDPTQTGPHKESQTDSEEREP